MHHLFFADGAAEGKGGADKKLVKSSDCAVACCLSSVGVAENLNSIYALQEEELELVHQ